MTKKVIVVYASKYGNTKRYAEWIAKALDADLADVKGVKPGDLAAYDAVVYGGGLYAGGIDGVKRILGNPVKRLVVYTVGLADPKVTDYGRIIKKSFSRDLAQRTKFFHLRGGVDYARLGPVHKAMMAMMKSMIQKKPESERSGEDREFLRVYNAKVDFCDPRTIEPLVAYVQSTVL